MVVKKVDAGASEGSVKCYVLRRGKIIATLEA